MTARASADTSSLATQAALTAETTARTAADTALSANIVPRPGMNEWQPGREWMTNFTSAEQDAELFRMVNVVRTTDGGTSAIQQPADGVYMALLTKERLRNCDIRLRYRTPVASSVLFDVCAVGRFNGSFGSSAQTITITGTPTGGTFTLSFNGATTTAIAFSATAATVQTALETLTTIGTGNVVCTGGPFPGTAVVATFQGAFEGVPQPKITVDVTSLTGGTPAASVAVAITPQNFAVSQNQWLGRKNFNPNPASGTLSFESYSAGDNANAGAGITAARDSGSTTPVRNLRMQLIEDMVRLKEWIETAQSSVYTVVITGSPTGGTFTLTYGGQTTSGIAFNATTGAVQTALQALSSIGSGNAAVTGSAGSYTVTFQGALASTETLALSSSAAGLTGGAPVITVTQTTFGSNGKEPDWQYVARVRTADTARSNVDIGRCGMGVRAYATTNNPYIYSLRVTELVRADENLILNSDYAITDAATACPAFWLPTENSPVNAIVTGTDRFGDSRTLLRAVGPAGSVPAGSTSSWSQWLWPASKGGPNAFVTRPRPYYVSVGDFPRVVEISIWTKGTNVVDGGGILASAATLYYYDKDGNVMNGGGDVNYYRPFGVAGVNYTVGPPGTGGTGTWDWTETRWREPVINPERIVAARLTIGLHDAGSTGTIDIGDVVIRAIG